MSFFRDLVAEVQKEINAATAEFRTDFQKSVGFGTKSASQGTHTTGHSSDGSQTAASFNNQQRVNPGVVEHPARTQTGPTNPLHTQTNRATPAEQRPQQQAQAKKRRKKPPQQQATATPQQQQQAQTQAKKATFIHPHKLVANLTPTVARSSIIMSEVLGPPVSKRQRRGWH